jgi:hypothetical protein
MAAWVICIGIKTLKLVVTIRTIRAYFAKAVHEVRAKFWVESHLEDVLALVDEAVSIASPIREIANIGPV